MKNILLKGGIGDFLLSLDAFIILINQPDINFTIITHYKDAPLFFKPFVKDFSRIKFAYFSSVAELHEHLGIFSKENEVILECPKFKIGEFNYPYEVESPFQNENEVIGIHPFGSNFSRRFLSEINFPSKDIPIEIVKKLIIESKNYIIFGSKDELSAYSDFEKADNVCLCYHDDIWVSLSHLSICSKIIACDSSFKTLSLTKKVDTYLIINDYDDEPRDKIFINPYLKDDHFNILKVKDISKSEKEIINFIDEKIYSRV